MLTDPLTKYMAATHLVKTLARGTWSITYHRDFVKEKAEQGKQAKSREDFPGTPATVDELSFLSSVRFPEGWHRMGDRVIQVARDARMFRRISPTFARLGLHLRTSFAQFETDAGDVHWQRLEKDIMYSDLPQARNKFGLAATRLITVFSRPI